MRFTPSCSWRKPERIDRFPVPNWPPGARCPIVSSSRSSAIWPSRESSGQPAAAAAGFALERPATAISLLEVIEAIDGPLVPGHLGLGSLLPEIVQRVEDALARASRVCRSHLENIHLSDLLDPATLADGEVVPEPVA